MFADRYKKDNDMIHADPSALKSILDKAKKPQPFRSKRTAAGFICAAACVLIVALTVTATLPLPPQQHTGTIAADAPSGVSSYDRLYDIISADCGSSASDSGVGGMVFTEANTAYDVFNDMAGSADAPKSPESADHSDTNTQVKGVDEADVVKTDGSYIYSLRDNKITIVSAQNGMLELKSTISYTDENICPLEMYVSGDRLTVLETSFGDKRADCTIDYFGAPSVSASVYDISDRAAPKKLSTLTQDGFYVSSRMVGDYVYIVTTHYISGEIDRTLPATYVPCVTEAGECVTVAPGDIFIASEESTRSYTVITSVCASSAEKYASVKAALGGANTIYSDTDSLVIAAINSIADSSEAVIDGENAVVRTYTCSTGLLLFSFADGAITEQAQCSVPGTPLNQFAIDEHDGVYRIVVTEDVSTETIFTDGIDRYEYDSTSRNALYTLDSSLNRLGSIEELSPGERVYSVRYDGDICYFVTFRQVDPLFTVDLSNPAAPAIMSTLKIPGFSQYLHPYSDGLLFGLGYDADEETGRTNSMKLSMFDVSDPFDVTEAFTLKLDCSWSEASYNHKAILISADRNLIAFPEENGYLIYGFSPESGFYKKAELSFGDNYHSFIRGLFIGDFFYVCTDSSLSSYTLSDFSNIDSI